MKRILLTRNLLSPHTHTHSHSRFKSRLSILQPSTTTTTTTTQQLSPKHSPKHPPSPPPTASSSTPPHPHPQLQPHPPSVQRLSLDHDNLEYHAALRDLELAIHAWEDTKVELRELKRQYRIALDDETSTLHHPTMKKEIVVKANLANMLKNKVISHGITTLRATYPNPSTGTNYKPARLAIKEAKSTVDLYKVLFTSFPNSKNIRSLSSKHSPRITSGSNHPPPSTPKPVRKFSTSTSPQDLNLPFHERTGQTHPTLIPTPAQTSFPRDLEHPLPDTPNQTLPQDQVLEVPLLGLSWKNYAAFSIAPVEVAEPEEPQREVASEESPTVTISPVESVSTSSVKSVSTSPPPLQTEPHPISTSPSPLEAKPKSHDSKKKSESVNHLNQILTKWKQSFQLSQESLRRYHRESIDNLKGPHNHDEEESRKLKQIAAASTNSELQIRQKIKGIAVSINRQFSGKKDAEQESLADAINEALTPQSFLLALKKQFPWIEFAQNFVLVDEELPLSSSDGLPLPLSVHDKKSLMTRLRASVTCWHQSIAATGTESDPSLILQNEHITKLIAWEVVETINPPLSSTDLTELRHAINDTSSPAQLVELFPPFFLDSPRTRTGLLNLWRACPSPSHPASTLLFKSALDSTPSQEVTEASDSSVDTVVLLEQTLNKWKQKVRPEEHRREPNESPRTPLIKQATMSALEMSNVFAGNRLRSILEYKLRKRIRSLAIRQLEEVSSNDSIKDYTDILDASYPEEFLATLQTRFPSLQFIQEFSLPPSKTPALANYNFIQTPTPTPSTISKSKVSKKATPSLNTNPKSKTKPEAASLKLDELLSRLPPSGSSSRELPPHLPIPSAASPPSSTLTSTLDATSVNSSFPPTPVASLSHGLNRVLFNPGVHFLQDPRTGVYNFSKELGNLPNIDDFEMEKLPKYVISSEDEVLGDMAKELGKSFVSSTSSSVGMLCQIYLWLSQGKDLNLSMLPPHWATVSGGTKFSAATRLPATVIAHKRDGHYAVDSDKSADLTSRPEFNVLAQYGHLMEKILTTSSEEFSGFLKGSPNPAPSEFDKRQAYHYMATDNLILRSQLDAHDDLLPNVTFDVKTRGTVAIRQDRLNYVAAAGYEIETLHGQWKSFDREYFDLIRSAFLKYQFQARIGAMDGCFLAYHNTSRFFGFQYIPLCEMDEALFSSQPGSREVGDKWFGLCINFLEKILKAATDCYEGHSVKITFASVERKSSETTPPLPPGTGTARSSSPLKVFVEPVDQSSANTTKLPPISLLEFDLASASSLPSSVSYSVQSHPSATGYQPREVYAALLGVQKTQQAFSSLWLPVGVSETEVLQAQRRVLHATEGEEIEEVDRNLAERFPHVPGVVFRALSAKTTSPLSTLRRLAREASPNESGVEEGREFRLTSTLVQY